MLLLFRVHAIAIVADIEKAYLQIIVNENHRDLLRCLWFDDIMLKSLKLLNTDLLKLFLVQLHRNFF